MLTPPQPASPLEQCVGRPAEELPRRARAHAMGRAALPDSGGQLRRPRDRRARPACALGLHGQARFGRTWGFNTRARAWGCCMYAGATLIANFGMLAMHSTLLLLGFFGVAVPRGGTGGRRVRSASGRRQRRLHALCLDGRRALGSFPGPAPVPHPPPPPTHTHSTVLPLRERNRNPAHRRAPCPPRPLPLPPGSSGRRPWSRASSYARTPPTSSPSPARCRPTGTTSRRCPAWTGRCWIEGLRWKEWWASTRRCP